MLCRIYQTLDSKIFHHLRSLPDWLTHSFPAPPSFPNTIISGSKKPKCNSKNVELGFKTVVHKPIGDVTVDTSTFV